MAVARRHDPIPRFGRYLTHHGLLDEAIQAELSVRADREVEDAVEFAAQAEAPPVDRAFADIY